jgi:hypothetical protein
MNAMRYIIAILISAMRLSADSIDVGGRLIEVPPPAGFVRVTSEMTEVKRLYDQMADPINDTLACYISEDSVPDALSGKIPELRKYFLIKVHKKLKGHTASVAEFAELQDSVESENKKTFDEVKKQLPGLFDEINGNIKKEYGNDIAIGVSQVVPLDLHHRSENAFSYSMFMNVGVGGGTQQSVSMVAVTATFLNTAGRVLFLYAYGGKDDLDWTRESSEAWQTAILSRNAPPPQKPAKTEFQWGRVTGKALVAGIVGGVAGLLGFIFSKKNRRESS